jgi:hypothetical protein
MNLNEWTVNYIKHRNLLHKSMIELIIVNDHEILTKNSYGDHHYYINDELDGSILEKVGQGHISVICLNKKPNIDFLAKNWDKLISNPTLCFIFANPDINQRWIIIPKTHDLVTERSALKRGLKSLFDSVEEVHG